jgi:hypothetical protein
LHEEKQGIGWAIESVFLDSGRREGFAMDKFLGFKSPGVVVALSIAVLILILGLFFGFGRILWILASAAVILIGVGVFVYFAEKKQ